MAYTRAMCANVGLVGLLPSCHRIYVGISLLQSFFSCAFSSSKFFSWVFRDSQIFSREYFVDRIFFFSRGFFVDPIFFYRRYFVGPKFFLVVISWVPNISSSVFRWSQFFFVSISWVKIFFLMSDLLIQRFPVASYMKKSDKKQKYRNTHQTTYFFPNRL